MVVGQSEVVQAVVGLQIRTHHPAVHASEAVDDRPKTGAVLTTAESYQRAPAW
jgi:hypothetical protein